MFKRAATELLSVNKNDVQSVLLATAHSKSEDIVKCLNLFAYFNGWSQRSVKECCILSTIKRFMPDTVILDDIDKCHRYTYFIIDGNCSVVQKIVIRLSGTATNLQNGTSSTRLKSNICLVDDAHSQCYAKDDDNFAPVFVKVRTFEPGDCFGVGENLTDRWIVSDGAVRCLVIPRDFLLRHNENNIWPRTRQRIDSSLPDTRRVYEFLIKRIKWSRFKTQYATQIPPAESKGVFARRKYVGTRVEDIPQYWRINVDVPSIFS